MDGREIALRSARILDSMKAANILVYDLRKSTDISDYFVIGTVTGPAHMTGIVNDIVKELKSHGEDTVRCDRQNMSQWVLIDCVDCVVHLFSPELREYYSLESLWGDSETLDWQEPASTSTVSADTAAVAVATKPRKPSAKKKAPPAKAAKPAKAVKAVKTVKATKAATAAKAPTKKRRAPTKPKPKTKSKT